MSTALQSRAARTARGTLAGTTAMLIAAVSHGAGGADLPGWLAIAVGLVFAILLGTLLTARRPSLPRLLAIVLPSQAAFHYLFVLLGGPGVVAAAHVHGDAATREAVAGLTGAAATGAAGSGSVSHLVHLTEPRMLAAHLVAAVATVVLLRWVEQALWTLLVRRASLLALPAARVLSALRAIAAQAADLVAARAAALARARAARLGHDAGVVQRLRSALLTRTTPLRGPPALPFV
ncbi:hypothetical protein [Schumannella sp. 10F1B-5-1]|uniref:hypothetical protein n=1 Tax=Schumannella sp. 10F1B-5-1 TaxID=2590780 RepID=UPI001130A5D9|nr:hypothetical protein [Schumannella sp. 10F1B-5-1]TPW70141.1 hypothetical protein FJ658_14040 [Schumannella sp. 10F1B-5-1]